MSSCCHSLYNVKFDDKRAKEELAKFRQGRMREMTQILIDKLQTLPLTGCTLLDIGGGIGAIPLSLAKQSLKSIAYNDLSTAYGKVFQTEIEKEKPGIPLHQQLGDFLHLHGQFQSADLVTLDKVICCYTDYKQLVGLSLAKAKRWYAYVLPRDVWWVRLEFRLKELKKRIKGDPFRSYIHPVKEIEQMVEGAGFRNTYRQKHKEWEIFIYEKTSKKEAHR